MQSYAVISVGVKISLITLDKVRLHEFPTIEFYSNLTYQLFQGNRNAVIDTRANSKLSDNISFVFGSKFFQTLFSFELEVELSDLNFVREENKEVDDDVGANDRNGSYTVKVNGFISKAGVGVGRSDNDRQFVYCNGRPVDLPKITRAMNEVCSILKKCCSMFMVIMTSGWIGLEKIRDEA